MRRESKGVPMLGKVEKQNNVCQLLSSLNTNEPGLSGRFWEKAVDRSYGDWSIRADVSFVVNLTEVSPFMAYPSKIYEPPEECSK
ncbi:unnamed protein product [Strongylus vulgaris]|uniref:Uncharacterized protein n=1 Tax=Strongylus vulgaris TaxID=40348 RepID=A0A3P7JLH2_STRVU|nr:unnamed protein product [Strongylus vulgaris]